MEKSKEILQKLIDLKNNRDIEYSHGKADDLLCELLTDLGYNEIVKVFNDIEKWYA